MQPLLSRKYRRHAKCVARPRLDLQWLEWRLQRDWSLQSLMTQDYLMPSAEAAKGLACDPSNIQAGDALRG